MKFQIALLFQAFGDISLREASLDKYPGSTLQDLCALGRAGGKGGTNLPEAKLT